MDNEKLLPCPWCGDDIDAKVQPSMHSPFWREVQGCCTPGPSVRHDTKAEDQALAERESRQAAINAWNTRNGTLQEP